MKDTPFNLNHMHKCRRLIRTLSKSTMEICVKTAKDFKSLTLFPLPISHSNFLKNFRKYKLVWTVFLWISIYIYLTYSEKFSGFCSSRKSVSGYFVRSTWKFSEIYIFVQIPYFLYSCRIAVFWWKDYIWW